MSLLLILLVISWSITVLVAAFAAWLFIRYGRLLLQQSAAQEPAPEPPEQQRPLSRRYDVAISLGERCEVAHQLNEHGYRTLSYPFDWIITPFSALCQLLERDFASFLNRDDLRLPEECPCIVDSMGLNFYHDFPITESFLSEYEPVKEKYDRRIARFREVLESGDRVAFVRMELSRDEAQQLRDLIRRKFPGLDFVLIAVNERPHEMEEWGLDQVRNFSIEGVEGWYGNTAAYGEVFEAVHLTRLVKLEEIAHTF
jgi:hypothetical protein